MFERDKGKQILIEWREKSKKVELWTTSPMWKERFEKMGFALKDVEYDREKPLAWTFTCPVKEFRFERKKGNTN
jgi:hypothetical protein